MARKYRRRYRKKKAKVSKAVQNYVHKAIDQNIEDKFNTFTDGVVTVNSLTIGELRRMTNVSQGILFDQRIADKIRIKWIDVRVVVNMVNGSNSGGRIRFITVVDKQPNQTLALASDNDEGILPTLTPGQGFRFPRNQETRERYLIKRDHSMDLQVYPYQPLVGAFSSIAETHHYFYRLNFGKRPLEVAYVDTGGNPTDTLKNVLYQVAYPDLIIAPNTMTMQSVFTVCYQDA